MTILARCLTWVSELIFPSLCELCQEGVDAKGSLCEKCRTSLTPLRENYCQRCAEPFDGAVSLLTTCSNCHDLTYSFSFALASLELNQPERELVHAFKYKKHVYLTDGLAEILSEVMNDPRLRDIDPSDWLVVPVPLHPKRERQRTFNQSAYLARSFARQQGIAYCDGLKRVKPTQQQARLSRNERMKNQKGAFALSRSTRSGELNGAQVLLIDDVFTTGATINECAKVLKKAGGAKVVIALTLARG